MRENASHQLEKQGPAAEAALRKALEARSAEVRKRAGALLAKLPQINLDALVVPEGMSAVGPEDLSRKGRTHNGSLPSDSVSASPPLVAWCASWETLDGCRARLTRLGGTADNCGSRRPASG